MEKETNKIFTHAIPLHQTTDDLLIQLINEETGMRGYLVTGNQEFLQPYFLGKEKLKEDLDIINSHKTLHPIIGKIVDDEVLPQINKIQIYFENQINLMNKGDLIAAQRNAEEGKFLMDTYRHIHAKLKANITELTDNTSSDSKRGAEHSRTIIIIGYLVTSVIAVLSLLLFIRARRTEKALEQSEERYYRLIELSPEPIGIHRDGIIIYINPSGAKVLGAVHPEELIGKPILGMVHPAYIELVKKRVEDITKNENEYAENIEEKLIRLDGKVIDVELTSIPTIYHGLPAIEVIFHDITERKQSEEALRKSEEKLRALFECANDAIFLFSLTADRIPSLCLDVNQVACDVLGYSKDELLLMTPIQLTPLEDLNKIPVMMKALLSKGQITFEGACMSKNGTKIPFEFSTCILNLEEEKIILSIARDITERKKSESLMKHMAYYDVLTQLPNRRLFEERLHQAVNKAHSHQEMLAVMFLDLDGFKQINDTFGHDAGDVLLQEVAQRLTTCARNGDTVARLAGDEFTLLLPDITMEHTISIAQQILGTLAQPVALKSEQVHITSSIGISFYPKDAINVSRLLKHADTAMYYAKQRGKNNYQLYQSDIDSLSMIKK